MTPRAIRMMKAARLIPPPPPRRTPDSVLQEVKKAFHGCFKRNHIVI
jgi:hypothetical protein